ncbi:hypothetical protein D9613_004281 [Agrocybe pediades]|uniref:Uncharacterized protein n=1 Tax=Agrocybe pediades TaxID=84607 RepID=A0A8H4VJD4_9AGAR|nr:hypothetical protein D9613_004281 [Agrocybe pediades]
MDTTDIHSLFTDTIEDRPHDTLDLDDLLGYTYFDDPGVLSQPNQNQPAEDLPVDKENQKPAKKSTRRKKGKGKATHWNPKKKKVSTKNSAPPVTSKDGPSSPKRPRRSLGTQTNLPFVVGVASGYSSTVELAPVYRGFDLFERLDVSFREEDFDEWWDDKPKDVDASSKSDDSCPGPVDDAVAATQDDTEPEVVEQAVEPSPAGEFDSTTADLDYDLPALEEDEGPANEDEGSQAPLALEGLLQAADESAELDMVSGFAQPSANEGECLDDAPSVPETVPATTTGATNARPTVEVSQEVQLMGPGMPGKGLPSLLPPAPAPAPAAVATTNVGAFQGPGISANPGSSVHDHPGGPTAYPNYYPSYYPSYPQQPAVPTYPGTSTQAFSCCPAPYIWHPDCPGCTQQSTLCHCPDPPRYMHPNCPGCTQQSALCHCAYPPRYQYQQPVTTSAHAPAPAPEPQHRQPPIVAPVQSVAEQIEYLSQERFQARNLTGPGIPGPLAGDLHW